MRVSPPFIELSHVGKCFNVRHEQATTFKDWTLSWASGRKLKREAFWALKDINLMVECGEVIGVLGLNGSGKSTLLRLIAQTLKPTEGILTIRGKVIPLLSLGLGFHPELTGQENLIMTCSIYGLTRTEIDLIYAEIVEFAELEKFIDVPLKQYSSGMRVRLAFSIATHLNPDIMVIDEVLSVGDKDFRMKSQKRIFDLKDQGKTILVAAHSFPTLRSLCDRACLLERGHFIEAGPVEEVIQVYQAMQTKPHFVENH